MASSASRLSTGAALHRLVTIRFSHYNEKARWALDFFRVPYVESGWLPVLSTVGVIAHGGAWSKPAPDRVSTRWSTPLLVTPEGTKVHDSHLILKYVNDRFSHGSDTNLYPTPEVAALEHHYHDFLGPHTRRVAYYHILQDMPLFFAMCRNNVSAAQFAAFKVGWPLFRGSLSRLGLSQDKARKSLDYVWKEFDATADRLEHRSGGPVRDYLVGDHFTAADLSFACMASPLLLVQPYEGYGAWYPPASQVSEELSQLVMKLRAHPAGAFALRMFRHHRGTRQVPGLPLLSAEPPHDVLGRPDERGKGGGGLGPGVV